MGICHAFSADLVANVIIHIYIFLEFLKNNMNVLDGAILVYQAIDTLFHNDFLLEFPSFRLFKGILVFRVLRITPHIPFLNYMMKVIRITLATFLYIAGILVALIVSYSLVGMQLFEESTNTQKPILSWVDQQNFDSFSRAFVSVFQVITLDNWYSLFIRAYAKHRFFSSLYFFSLIFIGNFILLKFFVANMLDGFEKTFDYGRMVATNKILTNRNNIYIHTKLFHVRD